MTSSGLTTTDPVLNKFANKVMLWLALVVYEILNTLYIYMYRYTCVDGIHTVYLSLSYLSSHLFRLPLCPIEAYYLNYLCCAELLL